MRVFVGIQFSSALKDDLEAYQAKLADWSEKGRLTRKENFHLMLFLMVKSVKPTMCNYLSSYQKN